MLTIEEQGKIEAMFRAMFGMIEDLHRRLERLEEASESPEHSEEG